MKKILSFLDIDMLKYIMQRIILMFITAFIIITVAFVIIRMMPDQPNMDPGMPDYMKELLEEKYGYNQPILKQYWLWLKNIIPHKEVVVCTEINVGIENHVCYNKIPEQIIETGDIVSDWGESYFGRDKGLQVVDIMKNKILVSMELNIYSLFVSVPIGIALGVIAALKKNTLIDYIISLGVIMLISIPSFVIALAMQYYVGFKWGILSPLVDYDTPNMVLRISSMLMPIIALSTGAIASMVRVIRAELTEVLTSDFMLLAKTKGLTTKQSTIRHAFRNALVPLVGMMVGLFLGLISGSLIIERIFEIPGVGSVMYNSMMNKDYNLTMASIAFYTIIGLTAGIIVDIGYGIVDPRIRVGGKK